MKFNPKKLIILACILLGAIFAMLIISFTVFAPQSIETNFLTTTLNLVGTETEIASASEIRGSVFFFNRNEAKERIEKEFPYAIVASFEIVFPNKIVIHCGERESLFAVRLSAYSIALVDEDLKVLEKVDSFTSTPSNEIFLDITPLNTSAKVGEFLEVGNEKEAIAVLNLKNALVECDRGTNESEASIKTISFHSEVIEGTTKNSLQIIIEDFVGFSATIYDFEDKPTEKIECYFRAICSITPLELSTKSMVIIETAEDGIVAVLVD